MVHEFKVDAEDGGGSRGVAPDTLNESVLPLTLSFLLHVYVGIEPPGDDT